MGKNGSGTIVFKDDKENCKQMKSGEKSIRIGCGYIMKRNLFLISFLMMASPALAQHWSKLPLPPAGTAINAYKLPAVAPYFLNSNIGFTFTPGIVGYTQFIFTQFFSPNLARTSDGGQTWEKLPFFDSIGCSITQLCFLDLEHGYASTSSGYKGDSIGDVGGIYETFDQGNSWTRITSVGINFSDVYATKNMIFASELTDPQGFGEIIFSSNDGRTWDSITNVQGLGFNPPPYFQLIYGNKDSLVATVLFPAIWYNLDTLTIVYSTDLGKHWNANPIEDIAPTGGVVASSLFIPPHSCNIFAESPNNDDTYNILEGSLPGFSSWEIPISHFEIGAWIAGSNCAMYVPDAHSDGGRPSYSSVFRSTDAGITWLGIGDRYSGPDMGEMDDWAWQNLSVVGYGSVVYAGTMPLGDTPYVARFWKTTDGGDGTLSATALAPRIEFGLGIFPTGNDTLVMTHCTPSSMVVYYQNLACAITKLDSISITGLGLNEYSLTSTNHNDCLSLPDTSYVTLAPAAPGTYPITVRAHFVDDEYNTIDTTLNFVLKVNAGGAIIPLNLHFNSSTITTHAGDTISIPIYLSGNATLGATSITLPFSLDTNVLRVIDFRPAFAGMTADAVIWAAGTVTVPLQDSGLTLTGDTIIGYLRCIVYLTDTLATSVTLQNASLNSAIAPCTALSLTTDSVNILINGCGDQTLLQFMKMGKVPFEIQSITPNPSSNDIDILFRNAVSEPLSYKLIDELGITRVNGEILTNSLSLDVSSLAQGIYFFRASTSDGFALTRKVVVEH